MNIDNKPYNGPQILKAKADVDKAMVYCCGDIHNTPVNNIVESFTTNNKSFMRNVKFEVQITPIMCLETFLVGC